MEEIEKRSKCVNKFVIYLNTLQNRYIKNVYLFDVLKKYMY